MRFGMVLLTNVVVAGLAILVYDTVRGDGAGPAAPDGGGDHAAASALEARVAALEARLDGLGSSRGERAVAARVADLESRVAALAPRDADAAAATPGAAPGSADPGAGAARTPTDASSEITPAEVARARLLMDRVEADRDRDRALVLIDAVLARLGISLTPQQRERLHEETLALRARMREQFPGGGPGGGPGGFGRPREEVFAAMQEAQRGFQTKLEEFLPATDAAAIAAALGPARGPGDGPRGGGPGGGGPPR